jgi:Holliday junction resolvasome RuvABC endonuclease subunit
MPKNLLKVLAINPGSKYIGIAVFDGPELEDWRIKTIKGEWSESKLGTIKRLVSDCIEQYNPGALVLKRLHQSRSSTGLNKLVSTIKQSPKKRNLKVYEYSIKDVKDFFLPKGRINKSKLAEIITSRYPVLSHDFRKEQKNKNSYYIRMFEAVALGAMCVNKSEKY